MYNDHVGSDMIFDKFFEMCKECCRDKFDFLVISKDDKMNNRRYCNNFDNIYN